MTNWKTLIKEMGIPQYRSSYLSPEKCYVQVKKQVRTLYGTTDWLKIKKGVQQCCLLSPCLFNLYAEHIMRNAGLDELQTEIKIGERNNSLRYADDTTLIEKQRGMKEPPDESEGGRMKRAALRLNIKKLRSWHPALLLHGKKKGKGWK